MECTPEEIAEKRRIALERLKAKKEALSAAASKTNDLPAASTSNNITTNPYQNARSLSHPYNAPKSPKNIGNLPTNNVTDNPIKIISCSCYMITDSRFVVSASGYYNKLIDVFRTIPSKSYDYSTKLWSFHLNDYNLVQERVNALNPNVVIGQLPPFVLQLFNETQMTVDIPLTSIEKNLIEVLMPFQKAGIRFGIEKKGRCLIADEMGLGKTYQALGLADFYKDDWPLLIVTTASTRDNWKMKIRELLPYVPRHSVVSITSEQDYIGDAKILIASYNLVERMSEQILKRGFGFVIFDESHTLKNAKAKITESALKLANKARRVVLLTGTPALSRPLELFTQLQMIDNNFFTYKNYTTRYCAGKQTRFGWDASGQSNLNELKLLLSRKFMIRRTKQDVLTELREKSRETILLDPALIWTSDDIGENMKTYAEDLSKMKGREKDDVLIKFYNETAHAKKTAVCAYIKGLIEEEQKFIVFAHHMVMLDAICDCLVKMNVDFIRIDGSTKNDIRTINVNRFQEVNTCRVAVLSIKACNSGITLTAAQLVLFAELDWNPSILAQAESRAHRIGQEGDVICRYLLAKGTADDVIWEMLKSKENILNKAGIFNEHLSDATNVIAPTTSNSVEKSAEYSLDRLGSQSSLDEAMAAFCTDNLIDQCNKKENEIQEKEKAVFCADNLSDQRNKKENEMQEKENISNNVLLGFLDEDDEDFLELKF